MQGEIPETSKIMSKGLRDMLWLTMTSITKAMIVCAMSAAKIRENGERGKMPFDYAIIDVEIGNKMEKATWDNKKADITLVGFLLVKNGMPLNWMQFFKYNDDFAEYVGSFLESLRISETPLWALNAPFEMDSLETLTGTRYVINELRQHLKGSLTSKDRLYEFLLARGITPMIEDVYKGDGSLAIEDYQAYKIDSQQIHVQRIAQHNLNCLLKEHYIKLHIQIISQSATTDEKGFILKL